MTVITFWKPDKKNGIYSQWFHSKMNGKNLPDILSNTKFGKLHYKVLRGNIFSSTEQYYDGWKSIVIWRQ